MSSPSSTYINSGHSWVWSGSRAPGSNRTICISKPPVTATSLTNTPAAKVDGFHGRSSHRTHRSWPDSRSFILNHLLTPNVKDETRVGERADDLNLGKMRSGARPCELRSIPRALSLSAGYANSFICLIEIQAKNVFFRVFASAIGEIFVFSDDFKTAFLQYSYRPDVVRCCLAKIG